MAKARQVKPLSDHEPMDGSEIHYIRTRVFRLSQAKFGKLIHRNPDQVSRYERGLVAIPPLVRDFLRLLVQYNDIESGYKQADPAA